MKRNFILLFLVVGFIQSFVANTYLNETYFSNDEKKKVILIIKTESEENGEFDHSDQNTGRSLDANLIIAELYNGVLSFSPYNIIGDTFVLRIYDKNEEDVLWNKVCTYQELNHIELPNLPVATYVLTLETTAGVYATEIAL